MHEVMFMELTEAYLCTESEAMGNSADRCPRCQSGALVAVTGAILRHEDTIHIIASPSGARGVIPNLLAQVVAFLSTRINPACLRTDIL